MEDLCEICGNEKADGALVCRFCGSKNENSESLPKIKNPHKVLNIEKGKPIVEEAMKKLQQEIFRSKHEKVAVLTIIHGYGSSGKGGAIRAECRKVLDFLEKKREIRGYILGENFTRKEGYTRSLLRRVPQLQNSDNLNRGNKGVTIVEL